MLLGLGLVWTAVEALFFLPSLWRLLAGLAVVAVAVAVAGWRLGRRLPARLVLQRLGHLVEARSPHLQQRLISALELWGKPRTATLYSPGLVEATVVKAAAEVKALELGHLAPLTPLKRPARWTGLAVGVALLAFWAGGESLGAALHRCLHPLTAFERPALTQVRLDPGDLEVVRGQDALVQVHLEGRIPATFYLQRRELEAKTWSSEEVLTLGADSLAYSFKQVKRPLFYRVVAGDAQSDSFRISVIEPPSVQRLRLQYHYPAYSGLPVRIEEESGDISALVGTGIEVEVQASKPLAAAALVVDDTMRIAARLEGDRAYARLEVRRSAHYQVELVDRKGVANPEPIRHLIHAIEDAPPQVVLAAPGRDMDLPESLKVMLGIEASDDFGFSRLQLVYRINEGGTRTVDLPLGPGRQLRLSHLWDLNKEKLLPEDRVYYSAQVFDNDAVSGPKKGVSRQFVLRFPSLYELFSEVGSKQEEGIENLENLVEEGEKTQRYLEQVQREVLKTNKLSWEQEQELKSTLKQEAARAKSADELAQQLEETLEQLAENNLATDELLQKLAEIRQLLAEVATPEMQLALEQLRQTLDNQNPEEIAKALEEFNQDQEDFQKHLDRTLDLLKQIKAEQELEAVAQQAAELEQRQKQIDESLQEGQSERRLALQEDHMQRDTGRLQQELERLRQSMEEISPQTANQLAEQAAAMAQDQLQQRMGQMSQQLRQGARSQAGQTGKGLERDLGKLAAGLQQAQEDFVQEQKSELAEQMRRAVADLVQLSHRQEQLIGQSGQSSGAKAAELAANQFALHQGLSFVAERVSGVSQKTMSLEQGVPTTLGHALDRMRQASQHLGQQDAKRAAGMQQQAMSFLNKGALEMRQSLDNLAQAQTPSGFGEAMQRMMGLSQQQAALNQATQQGMGPGQKPGQQGRPGQHAQISRLAAEQRRIYEALGQLRQGLRGHQGGQQRLKEIEDEMRQVLQDMERLKIDQNTLDTQKRIEQRMLDVSRSIYSRGFEKKRQSQQGQIHAYEGAAQLPGDLGQSFDRWRQAMQHALDGPYPDEYRALIRRYYELVYQDLHQGKEVSEP